MKSIHPPGQPVETLFEQLRDHARREESFQLLFDRFYWPLFRFFEGRGFSTEECQDLVQETFLRVYRGAGSFRGEARWDHWLFRIAANTAVKALRHRAATKRAGSTVSWEDEDVEEPPDEGSPAPLRRLLDQERKELLSQAIGGLPAQMRRCVRLRVFQDLDYEEIAEVLRISPSTVKVQLFKARKRLQGELRDSFPDLDL
ncbi:MAG TPA: sigma-70 family RNA polymerase sigma factor [Thermoanaerobaculia bacterium]|jgi:RNA polymerase sigma-70 factor (ECF subfamily)|nr:sigma-70 family RNA polymerase sigma factor [Thermoanaerobaculia bacterium]